MKKTQLILVFICTFLIAKSQSSTEVCPRVIHVKFKREMADQLKTRTDIGKTVETYYKTGDASLDQLNKTCSAIRFTPVFKTDPRHAKRHQIHGLDLFYEIAFDGTFGVEDLCQMYAIDENVLVAEPVYAYHLDNIKLPNDLGFYNQWGLKNTSLAHQDIDIKAPQAWVTTTGDTSVIVAIIDNCVDISHTDLRKNRWINTREIPNNGVDDDNNGYVDDYWGWNFRNSNDNVLPELNSESHGTHVAGIVAASTDNLEGIAGIAGGWGNTLGVRMMMFRTGYNNSEGREVIAYGYSAMVYAADNGAAIAQCSWGGGSQTSAASEAINYFTSNGGGNVMKGGLVIAAAGNENTDQISFPAGYAQVLSVGSVDIDGNRSSFSNYGSWVDICAPGSNIYSTIPSNAYGNKSGTSMACPMVSGVAALVLSVALPLDINLKTPTWLRNILVQSAMPMGSHFANIGPLVQAGQAVAATAALISTNQTALNNIGVRIDENPCKSSLKLSGNTDKFMKYQIFDIQGRQMMSGTVNMPVSIDIVNLQAGRYIIKLVTGSATQSIPFVVM